MVVGPLSLSRARLLAQLLVDEGLRLKPYRDTVGKLSIGIGRNLDDTGISEGEAHALCENDLDRAEALLDRQIPWWRGLDAVRQEVLLNMAFNMGWGNGRKGLSSFRNTLASIKAGLWINAARGMRASRWAKQVGDRASRLASAMEHGTFDLKETD